MPHKRKKPLPILHRSDAENLRDIAARRILFGPYLAPPVRIGDELTCSLSGLQVVGGWHGPKQWPKIKSSGWPRLIVCGDLVKALSLETCQTVATHWGIHPRTVANWRRRLNLNVSVTSAGSIYKAANLRTAARNNPERWVLPHVDRFKNIPTENRRQLGRRTAGDHAWSENEIAKLHQLVHLDARAVATLLGRSTKAVASAQRRYKIERPSQLCVCRLCGHHWKSFRLNPPIYCPNKSCGCRTWNAK